jgi:hypothetical protein
MINIKRTEDIPKSLQNPAIQTYIDSITSWKENPVGEKPSFPISYRNADILDAFDECFYSKCYLTEQQFDNSYLMDIEHFYPKNQFPEKRYDWTNLYPADHDANMAKPNTFPFNGYLDPCDKNDDVEQDIVYHFDFKARKVSFYPLDATNSKAVNTAELLERIHNGYDKNSKKKAQKIIEALKNKRDSILHKIIEWKDAKERNDKISEIRLEGQLKLMLSRKSSFTMLMRSTSAVRTFLGEAFFD